MGVEFKRYTLNDKSEITIRPALMEDEQKIVELCESVTNEDYISLQATPTPLEIRQVFKFPDYFISLVTEHDGNIVGYGEIKKSPCQKKGELRIYTHKDYRGVGLGTSMMIMLLREATYEGLQKINLMVAAVNLPAVHLFRKFGFQVYRVTGEDPLLGRRNNAIYMHRILNKETDLQCIQCNQAILCESFLIEK